MTLKKYREEYTSLKPKTVKDRERKCLGSGCGKKFKTDKSTFMCFQCGKNAERNGDYGI